MRFLFIIPLSLSLSLYFSLSPSLSVSLPLSPMCVSVCEIEWMYLCVAAFMFIMIFHLRHLLFQPLAQLGSFFYARPLESKKK